MGRARGLGEELAVEESVEAGDAAARERRGVAGERGPVLVVDDEDRSPLAGDPAPFARRSIARFDGLLDGELLAETSRPTHSFPSLASSSAHRRASSRSAVAPPPRAVA